MKDLKKRYWCIINPLPAATLVAIARQAEAQGLAGLFAPDHYPYPPTPKTGRFRAVRTRRFSARCNWVKITQLVAIT